MLVNQLQALLNIPKHASRMDRLSIKSISSLSQGSKTNPRTKVAYYHRTKVEGLQGLQSQIPIRILIIFILKPSSSTKSHKVKVSFLNAPLKLNEEDECSFEYFIEHVACILEFAITKQRGSGDWANS